MKESDVVRVRARGNATRVLAADAMRIAISKDRTLTKSDAFVKLFVDPLLDANFALFVRGWSMELHPQNFLLKFDDDTGLVKNVVIRDLHGLAYSASERAQRGLPDQMSLASLQANGFPEMSQQDIDGYFQRNGALRDRYQAPAMFQNSLDFFTTIFWYHLLGSLESDGTFSKDEVNTMVETIKDRMSVKAKEHGFDLAALTQPGAKNSDYWDADKNGVRGRILFRRAV